MPGTVLYTGVTKMNKSQSISFGTSQPGKRIKKKKLLFNMAMFIKE